MNPSDLIKKFKKIKKKHLKVAGHGIFWFLTGALIALFLIVSFSYIVFVNLNANKVYSGVSVDGVDFSKKTKEDVKNYFTRKNEEIGNVTFVFTYENTSATASARDIEFGYDPELLASQAISVGRSNEPISNLSTILGAQISGVHLPASYKYSDERFEKAISPTIEKVNKNPIEALFKFENGKVNAFRPSENGRQVDKDALDKALLAKAKVALRSPDQKIITIQIPVKILKPSVTTDKVNKLGIEELIGTGTSLFQHSIEGRIHNVNVAASKINGILIPPGSVFSFNRALGDVSAFTGYKQAYVIENGKTVLGDGGGVCQVSTTLFRAALNTGLPVVERHAHAYRVGYYEQDSPPGIDATIYVPTVDLKFKNDTKHHILIQTIVDMSELRLTFMLYGTKDGRIVELGTPVVSNQTPAPPPLYQDDPTLPKGTEKQVDFAAPGASVYFTRKVTKDGKEIISDKFASYYRPWQAVFLKGTKE